MNRVGRMNARLACLSYLMLYKLRVSMPPKAVNFLMAIFL